jgi:hypothetical protein
MLVPNIVESMLVPIEKPIIENMVVYLLSRFLRRAQPAIGD